MHGLLIEKHSNWFIGHLYPLAAVGMNLTSVFMLFV